MEDGQTVPANPEPSELLEPAQRPLDRPAEAPQVVAILGARRGIGV